MQKLMLAMTVLWSMGVFIILYNYSCQKGHTGRYRYPVQPQVGPDDIPWMPYNIEDVERRHVFFLNVHNTGGEVVRDVLLRFARPRGLTVLLPRATPFAFSHTSKEYWNNTDPRAWDPERHNDIVCDYLVFNERFPALLMPRDTMYVAIVHSPFQRFTFTFKHYTAYDPQPYLTNITGPYPVATYLDDPARWEPPDPSLSFTNNRMAFDFGLDPQFWSDKRAIRRYMNYLEKRFDLVMVGDKLDESLVMLKRLAGWRSLRDIVYIRPQRWEVGEYYVFNETQRNNYRRTQYADYYLYHRFSNLLNKRMAEESDDGFYEEVNTFKDILGSLKLFCEQSEFQDGGATSRLLVKPSEWNEEFHVTGGDCARLSGRLPLVDWTRLELTS